MSDGQCLRRRRACRNTIGIPRSRSDRDPEFGAGRVARHRARRLSDGGNPAFSDPFLVMAEDWAPRDAFSRQPHRGIETVILVLDGALEHFYSAGNIGVIYAGDAQWMTAAVA